MIHEVGTCFGESVHQRAMVIALQDRGLLVETNITLGVTFRGHEIGLFRPDIVVERLVIVEIKAVATLDNGATAQILSYLRCAGGGVGFLMNFGNNAEYKRFVSGHPSISLPLLPKDPVENIERWLGTGALPGTDSAAAESVQIKR